MFRKLFFFGFFLVSCFFLQAEMTYYPTTTLVEDCTATWCTFCPDAYAGINAMHQLYNHDEFVSLRYYSTSQNGNYGNAEIDSAISFYGVNSFPSAIFNGTRIVVGGGDEVANGNGYLPIMQQQVFKAAPLKVTVTNFDRTTGQIGARVKILDPNFNDASVNVKFVLVEENVTSVHTEVTRDIINIPLDLIDGAADVAQTFTIPAGVVNSNLQAVVFVQKTTTKEIFNTASTFTLPDYRVRLTTAHGQINMGSSTEQVLTEDFMVLNPGLADTYTISVTVDSAPEGSFVAFCDSVNCYIGQTTFSLNSGEAAYFHANIMPGGRGNIRYHFTVNSENLTTPVEIPFLFVNNDADVLIVDDDGVEAYENYFATALTNNSCSYSVWDLNMGKLTEEARTVYSKIIWQVDDSYPTLDAEDRQFLMAYLDSADKNLFITGQDIGWDLNDADSGNTNATFYHDYLHANYLADDVNLYQIAGVQDNPLSSGLSFNIAGGDGADNQAYPSKISARAGATEILYYQNSSSVNAGCAAISATHGSSRIVYFAFGFEAINNQTDRDNVMSRILNWFGNTPAHGNTQNPVTLSLNNYPNPFNPVTTITYQLEQNATDKASLAIYNIKGQLVKKFNAQDLKNGNGKIVWNGIDKNNKTVAGGVYFSKLQGAGKSVVKKMVLIK